MTELISEEQEQQFAERFSNGQSPQSPLEAGIHETYRKLDGALCTMHVPPIDHAWLAARMAAEADSIHHHVSPNAKRTAWNLLERIPAPVFATVCAVLICLLVISYAQVLQAPESPLVQSFSMFDPSTQKPVPPPRFWSYRVQRGQSVTVPAGLEARLELADGSRVRCMANTRLAFSPAPGRKIDLENGTVFITAEPGLDLPLRVVTELGTVEVTGTEFRVSVIR